MSMKKMFFMLVLLFVTVASKAQYVNEVNYSRMEFRVGNAWYNMADVLGGTQLRRGDNVMVVVNNAFTRLRHDDPEAYVRELNAWNMSGGLAGVQPVRYSTATMGGMMMGGGMMGGAMMGTGMNNSGMVYGAGGMAGATSNVQVTNQNMMATVGSGLQAYYDTGSNSLSVSGDPLMAAGRLLTFISGSKKAKAKQTTNGGYTNGQVLKDANGNQYVVNNGVLVPARQQQSRQSVQTRTNSGVATQPVYNVASGF